MIKPLRIVNVPLVPVNYWHLQGLHSVYLGSTGQDEVVRGLLLFSLMVIDMEAFV